MEFNSVVKSLENQYILVTGATGFLAKVTPVAGDISLEDLGIDDSNLINKIRKEIDVVASFAATTKSDESFDDSNTEKLRMEVRMTEAEANIFYYDPKCINWDDYFMNVHIPGLVKYLFK